jgi:hypothetical protein
LPDVTLAKERYADLNRAFLEIADLAGDPFHSRYCTSFSQLPIASDSLRVLLKRYMPRRFTYTKVERAQRTDEYLAGKSPLAISPTVDRSARFIVAFVGGAALIVPVLIMSFHATKANKLTTLSVAVLLFAIAMAVVFRATNAETLVAIATYAAVLVVFVGTSG